MKEPRTAKGRETRDRIVEVAAHLMHLRGVSATSVDDVADVGKGQFYHYFDGRSELEAAVLAYQVACQPESRDPNHPPATWAEVRAWFASAYELYALNDFEGGCPLGAMASEVADRDARLREALDAAFRTKIDYLTRGLTEMHDSGALRSDADPERLAEFSLIVLQGGLLLARTRRDGAPLRNAIEQALAHLESFRPEA